MINFNDVPANSVLPIPFDSFAGSTGASITLTGLALADILVYKGTSMTQRASTAGFALMDTDGIDLDGITGIHGFSIDTSDNTDAGFYTAGSFYWVVISSVAATFRLSAAESIAGTPKADMSALGGAAQSATDLKDFADDGYDPATNKVQGVVLTDTVTTYTGDTPQTGDSFARIGATGAGLTSLASAANLATVAGFIDTEIGDIQNRIPAALTGGGNMKSDVLALNGDTAAAAVLAILNGATIVYSGTVTGAATTTTLIDSGLTQADTDWWKGRIIIFKTVIPLQATDITAFDPATDKLTFTATTQAPTGATYVII